LVLHPKNQWYQQFMPMALFRNVRWERECNSTMVWWRTDLTYIICLKKMQRTFIKPVK
jgi:hypothetical protein